MHTLHVLAIRFAFIIVVALLPLATGCATTYTPGAIFKSSQTATHAARRRGCVDISVSLAEDDRLPVDSVLLAYEIGNACSDAHTVDLARVNVTATTEDGAIKLYPYDPPVTIHAAIVDGLRTGKEAIRYDPRDTGSKGAERRRPDRVCVDLRAIVADAADDGQGVVCLDTTTKGAGADLETPGVTRALGGCNDERRWQTTQDCWQHPYDWEIQIPTRLRGEIGMGYHHLDPTRFKYWRSGARAVNSALLGDRIDAGTFDMRLTGFATRALYWGGELGFGFGTAPRVAIEPAPSTIITAGPSVHIVSGGVVGLSTRREGRFSARAELLGGGRFLAITSRDAATDKQASSYLAASWIAEPRVAIEMWARPDLSLSLWAGADVLHLGDVSSGLSLVMHTRSFDAR